MRNFTVIVGASCVWLGVLASGIRGRDLTSAAASPLNTPAEFGGSAAASSATPAASQTAQAMDSAEQARANSAGCVTCHTNTDEASMHPSGTVVLGCTTCHGGDASVSLPAGVAMDSHEYVAAKK